MSDSLRPHGLQPARLLCPWDSPGKNTGAGCHFLLQGIFPIQESNPGLLHGRQILYRLSHQGRSVVDTIVMFILAFSPLQDLVKLSGGDPQIVLSACLIRGFPHRN